MRLTQAQRRVVLAAIEVAIAAPHHDEGIREVAGLGIAQLEAFLRGAAR